MPRCALDANTAVMLLHNDAANVQAQAQSSGSCALSLERWNPVESPPGALIPSRFQTRPVIANGHEPHRASAVEPDVDRLPRRSVLHRVGKVVRENLRDAICIDHHNGRLALGLLNMKHMMWMDEALLSDHAGDDPNEVRPLRHSCSFRA